MPDKDESESTMIESNKNSNDLMVHKILLQAKLTSIAIFPTRN